MIYRIRSRIRRKDGYSLAEVLIATLILMMATSIVAAGIPLAANAYNKVIDASNAQVLLSTTMTRLREELSTATEITADREHGIIRYISSGGVQSEITYAEVNDVPGLYVVSYPNLNNPDDYTQWLLVSKTAANKNLHMTFTLSSDGSVTGGVLEFSKLSVSKDNDPYHAITSVDGFAIRLLN